jgi:steroid delta-isomerase-like uncharacterized protein
LTSLFPARSVFPDRNKHNLERRSSEPDFSGETSTATDRRIHMPSKNVETIRAAHECWNKRDYEGVVRNMTDGITYTDYARGHSFSGKQRFREWTEDWAQALPDGKITNATYIDAGDTVVVQFTGAGTNTGPFAGLPPTGRHVTFPFVEIWDFDQSGRMISGDAYYDQYTILTQLGLLKPLAIAA